MIQLPIVVALVDPAALRFAGSIKLRGSGHRGFSFFTAAFVNAFG